MGEDTLLELFGLEPQLLSDDEETTAGEEDTGEKVEEKASRRPVRKTLTERNKTPKKKKVAAKNAKTPGKAGKTPRGSQKHRKSARAAANGPYNYRLFYGSNAWLSFMRLHHILVDRLSVLKTQTEQMTADFKTSLKLREEQERIYKRYGKGVESHEMNAADTNRGLLLLKPPLQSPKYFYKKVLDSVKNLLDGQMESSAFEDSMRSMFDTRAYLTFTIDKHIQQMGRYLQQMINDQTNTKCLELYQKMKPAVPRTFSDLKRRAKKNGVPLCDKELKYQTQAELLLRNQNCFKMLYMNASSPILSIEYLNTESVESEDEEQEKEEEKPTVSGAKSAVKESKAGQEIFVH
uniref:Sin3a_C domain-containing protein n=1 Tax=Steinernema glaseri TaxID=37863 RepID=A0A1I8A1R3_9BILA